MKLTRLCARLLFLVSLITLRAGTTAAQPQPTHLTQPTQLSFFGMNMYMTGLERISRDGDNGIAQLVALGREAGVEWAREELSWGNLERRRKGRWDWNYFDRRLLELAESGYGIVGMLLTTPAWARVDDCEARIQRYAAAGVAPQDYWCPPANVQDFADYVYATVERYDGDGHNDAPGSPRVAVWQIWNEPNAWETWPGTPAEYGELLRAGYAAARAADPSAVVATGGLYVLDGSWADSIGHSDGLRFLDAALVAVPGAWNAFDALAIHPYMPDVAPDEPGILARVTLWGRITLARDWLAARTKQYGGAARPLWISEVGWSTCSAAEPDCYAGLASVAPRDYRLLSPLLGPQPAAVLIGKREDEQASYMVRAHAIALALGVQHLNYFQFEDKFDGSLGNFWEEASILHTKDQGYRPKQAYGAYAVLTQQLAGAQFVGMGPLNTFRYDPRAQRNPAARYHLRFNGRENMLIDVLWRNEGSQEVEMTPEPGRSVVRVTLDGRRTPLAVNDEKVRFTVGEQPIYLQQLLPPVLTVFPEAITVLVEPGDAPQTIGLTVGNNGSGPVRWSVSADASWLRPLIPNGAGWRSTLQVQVDPGNLSLGRYRATLRITGENAGTRAIPVEMRVIPEVQRVALPLAGYASPTGDE